MQVQSNFTAGNAQNNQALERRTNNPRSGTGFTQQPPRFNNQILQLLLQLVVQLLQQLLGQQQPEPQPDPKALELTPNQQDNLKQLLGLDPNAPIGVQVLDSDGSGTLSVGDTAIANGGITGGEISRRTLTADDIAQINQTQGNVPQAFTDNLQKWQGFTNSPDDLIAYTTQQSCFCPQEFTRPINVTEVDGQINSAIYADTNQPVPDNVRQSLQTVDQRFEQLRNAYETGADTVNVQYDPQSGFPASVFIDQSQQIADEEVRYTISDLFIALP